MGKIIMIANQKGGVGKTTTAISMSSVLSNKGFKVLVIDADDTGNPTLSKNLGASESESQLTLTDYMIDTINTFNGVNKREPYRIKDGVQRYSELINEKEVSFDFLSAENKLGAIAVSGLSYLPEEKRMNVIKEILINAKSEYDYIIIDSAPALNLLTKNILVASDEVIITTQATDSSEEGMRELISNIYDTNHELVIKGLLVTMVDKRTKYNKRKFEEISKAYKEGGFNVFDTYIPRSTKAESCAENHESILKHDYKGKVSEAYHKFVDEYLKLR